MDAENADIRVIDSDEYALVVTIDWSGKADLHGTIDRGAVAGVLRQLADRFDSKNERTKPC